MTPATAARCPSCRGSGYSNEGIGRSPVAYRPCRECRGSGLSRPDPIAPGPGREAGTAVLIVLRVLVGGLMGSLAVTLIVWLVR